jgi:hypothetical protein
MPGPGDQGSGPGPDAAALAGWHGFGEYLRRALQAAADQVEPQPDGLAPIRARILTSAGVPWKQAFAISQCWIHDA